MALSRSYRMLFLLTFVSYLPCVDSRSNERLLMILLDGVRHDYRHQPGLSLPGFEDIARRGVEAGALIPDFPSLSCPNHYTLLTGLHTESHGITGNYMYDVTRNESFLMGLHHENFHPHWWETGDPIWITATKQNRTTHMYHWPGCEVEIHGLKPSYCLRYTDVPTLDQFRSDLADSLTLLRSGHTDMTGIYVELPDSYGHIYGPFSTELKQLMSDLDLIMSDLAHQLSDPELSDVNLMVFSDHGMTQTSPSRVIDIDVLLHDSDYQRLLEGYGIVSIYTTPDTENQVFNKLHNSHPNMTVYRKSDLPERWCFKNGRHVAPLTAVADLGWTIVTPKMKQMNFTLLKGYHGYDNVYSDMSGIFLAMGPSFKGGQKVTKLRNVDLYQIMCNILHIQPSPNNGSRYDVTSLLVTDGVTSAPVMTILIFITLASLFICYKM